MTPSDQRPREEKSTPYRSSRYEFKLTELKIYKTEYGEEITMESEEMCQKLLNMSQPLPEGSVFADDLFKKTLKMLQNESEARIMVDLARLIVPSAEILAIRGAKTLENLKETINSGWNNTVPMLGARPQPDFSLGFKRHSFNTEQLR